VFIDGPRHSLDRKNIQKIQEILKQKRNFTFEKIFFREKNLGLQASIKNGLDEIFIHHSSVIVLEDDLLLHPNFVAYINEGLVTYRDHLNIGTISGYHFAKFPVFYKDDVLLSLRHSSWGWATWENRWRDVNWDVLNGDRWSFFKVKTRSLRAGIDYPGMLVGFRENKISSWSVPFDVSCLDKGLLSVHPRIQYVQNMGFDGSGTNYSFEMKKKQVALESTSTTQLSKSPKFSLRYHWKIWLFSSPIIRIIRFKFQ
jgi:hypothetical protein